MESATNGREQFMYVVGQLSERDNEFWALEFEGYHGLRSANDIPQLHIDHVCGGRLTTSQLEYCHSLLIQVVSVIRDPICFQLISMIMLLDTTDLVDDDDVSHNAMDTEGDPNNFGKAIPISLPEAMEQGDMTGLSASSYYVDKTKEKNQNAELRKKKKPGIKERFKEINQLQKFYIILLRKHCMTVSNSKLRILCADDTALKRIMFCIKQMAQFLPDII